jgi:UDP-GlcNAc3NAcA epimerase
MKKVMTIVGARPQFIKAATVFRAIAGHNKKGPDSRRIAHLILHTGQHYDPNLSQIFFEELEIAPPDYNLGIGSESHGVQTGRMLEAIEGVLQSENPDFVVTYGDTNSTLAGALAASKLHIPAAHVEAGLRSYNRQMPEEINRLVADELCNILFCPTATAVANLKLEGIPSSRTQNPGCRNINSQSVYQVGDVMYDSILFYRELAQRNSCIMETLGIRKDNYCLATLHRAENTDHPERLRNILYALASIAADGTEVIVPLHPRTQSAIHRHHISVVQESGNKIRLHFIEPVGYLDMLQLEANAKAIFTDSGGVQKEAFCLRVPCITLRDETEWIETVFTGWNTLAGASYEKILTGFRSIAAWSRQHSPFENATAEETQSAYGDGHAAEKITNILLEYLA